MKRKDIKTAIEKATTEGFKVREKADIYLNVLETIWDVSDVERCDYYDKITLYIFMGIEPDFDSISTKKAHDFRLIFSLLKKQRIGFENATKSNSYDVFAYGGKTQAATRQVIKNKDSKNKEYNLLNNKIEDEETSRASAPPPDEEIIIDFDALVNHYNETTKGVFGKLTSPLSDERQAKITELIKRYHGKEERTGKNWFVEAYTKAAESDFLKGSNDNNWRMTFDWMLKPDNFEKILSGNYDNYRLKVDLNALKTHRDVIGTNFVDKD